MKIWNSQCTIFISIILVAVLSSCTLDDPGASDQSAPLTLVAEQNLSLTKLTWDRVNVTGFKEYILLQSSSDIPDNPTPAVNQDVTVVKRIKDVNETSTSVSPILIASNACFKLYCAVDDRFLYSATICIQQNINYINGFNDVGCHMPGNDEMVLFNRSEDLLSTVNYKTTTLTKSVPEFSFNFPSLEMSEWSNTTNVFGFDQSPPNLRKFTYPSLINTQTLNFNQVLWAAKSYQQFVFVATEEFGNGFQVLNRNTLTTIDSRTGMTNNQNIAVFPGDPMTVITFGVGSSKKYSIDATGKILEVTDLPVSLLQANLQSTSAQGTELFIADAFGSIFNRDGEKLGTLSTSQNSFIQMIRLSPDEKKAVYLINENGAQKLEIADLTNLPAVSVVNSYDLPALNFADIIPEEEIIYVVGTVFNGVQTQTYFLKFPM